MKQNSSFYIKKIKQFDILDDAVEAGDTDGIRDWFTALFSPPSLHR